MRNANLPTISAPKAKKILHDKKVHGHPLTDKQRKFFGAMSNLKAYGGRLDEGGSIDPSEDYSQLDETLDPDNLFGQRVAHKAFRESSGNVNFKNASNPIISSANARGPLQIRAGLYGDYQKATGDKTPYESVDDIDQSLKVYRWHDKDVENASFVKGKPHSNESLNALKEVIWHMGRGNTLNYLNKQKAKGVNIYDAKKWVKELPPLTKQYANDIILHNNPAFENDFQNALKKNPLLIKLNKLKHADGGEINSLNKMKQDKNIKDIYWHGGKMYFTGGAMMDFMKNNRSEIQGTNAPVIDPNELPTMHALGDPIQQFNPSGLPMVPNQHVSVQPTQYSDQTMNLATGRGANPASLTNMASGNVIQSKQMPITSDATKAVNPAGASAGNIATTAAPFVTAALNLTDKPNSPGMSAAKGAVEGAAAGAALGPIGMGVGAVVGGGLAYLNAEKDKKEKQMQDMVAGRQIYGNKTANPDQGGIYSAAYGGPIGNHSGGGSYAQANTPLTSFNTGGSHEENPNGGINQGPNDYVEQGETKYNNYIFSDRLKLDNAKDYNLGDGYAGKTFSEISKKVSKLADERPNDPITRYTQKVSLQRLKSANDDAIEMKKFADGNSQLSSTAKAKSKFEYGGYIFKDI